MPFVAAEPDRSLVASSSPPTRRRPSGTADLPGKRGGERTLGPRTERARELRNNMTNTEWRVWSRIRGKQLMGFKFRRQLAIGDYFVDFACVAARLAVEIDGPQHEEESDRRKTAYLEAQGFRVTRIPVGDVDDSLDDVIATNFRDLESPHPGAASGARPPRRAGR